MAGWTANSSVAMSCTYSGDDNPAQPEGHNINQCHIASRTWTLQAASLSAAANPSAIFSFIILNIFKTSVRPGTHAPTRRFSSRQSSGSSLAQLTQSFHHQTLGCIVAFCSPPIARLGAHQPPGSV
jgi:hypothetical protein